MQIILLFFLLFQYTSQKKFICSKECIARNCDSPDIYYGNYCGMNHSGCEGVEPCDAYDRCCQAHDICVGKSKKSVMDTDCHSVLAKCLRNALSNNEKTWTDQCKAQQIVDTMAGGMDLINMFAGILGGDL